MKKIFIAAGFVVVILVSLLVLAMAYMFSLSFSNNSYKGDYTNILKSTTSSEKKALVVYQPSKSEEFTKIANQLAKGLNESGYEVTISYPGKHLSSDVKDYSVLAFGSPIYMGQPSTALTDYMKDIKDYSDKKVIAFAIGSLKDTPENPSPEFEVFKKSLNNGELYKKVKFIAKDKGDEDAAYKLGLDVGKE